MAKGGRPRKPGERYPSGDLKPKGEAIAPAVWARIKADAVRITKDERLGTELGRLSFHGELTNAQTAAGFRVAEIYRRYHRLKRLRDTAKSPTFQGGSSGSADLAEERMDAEHLEAHEDSIRAAEADWKRLQEELPLYLREIPDALIELCVFDRPLSPVLLPDIRIALDRLATAFGDQWRRQGRGSKGTRPLLRKAATAGPDRSAIFAPRGGPDPNVQAVEAIARKLRLDETGVAAVRETFMALVARARYRRRSQTPR
jgi:hypothetical protein